MKRAVIAMAIAACNSHGSSSTLLVDGLVIGISEGEQRAFRLDRSGVSTMNAPEALGATIAENQLVLNVACNAVPGTTGPTREFELELLESDGAVTVVTVEVHPSGLPPCAPRLIACVHTIPEPSQGSGRSPCLDGNLAGTHGTTAIDSMTADKCRTDELVPGARIEFDYLGSDQFSNLNQPDRALLLHLVNPDSTDGELNFAVATDSPLKTPPSHIDECVSLPNANIVGTFSLDWTIVRGLSPSDPLVAAGTWELAWNKSGMGTDVMVEKYGLEVLGCATASGCTPGCATNSGCVPVRRSVQQQLGPEWCIPTATTDRTSVKMRLWATPAPGEKTYPINISTSQWTGSTTPTFDGDGHRGDNITVQASAPSIPMDVQVDVDSGMGDLKVTIDGNAMSSQYGPPHDLTLHIGGACLQ
jgi:hypothetical protein